MANVCRCVSYRQDKVLCLWLTKIYSGPSNSNFLIHVDSRFGGYVRVITISDWLSPPQTPHFAFGFTGLEGIYRILCSNATPRMYLSFN